MTLLIGSSHNSRTENKGRLSFRDSVICYIAKQNKTQILKNALRFQRQHQATSDHVKQRSTFRG